MQQLCEGCNTWSTHLYLALQPVPQALSGHSVGAEPAAVLQCPAGGAQLTQLDVHQAGVDGLGLAPVDNC